jgi:TatD DNase family protein
VRLYDIHAHLADERVLADAGEILRRSAARGVAGVLVAAARATEWDAVTRLSRAGGVYGALGVHPFFLEEWGDGTCGALRERLRAEPGVRAVGEIGLDFPHGDRPDSRQLEALRLQLEIARECGLPVILHNRKSWAPFFRLLEESGLSPLRGVCHHFTGSRELLRSVLDAGLSVSFCGPVTYPNARRIRDIVRYVPEDRILTETDAPDLPPASRRGQLSYPWCVAEVLETLAEIRGVTPEAMAAAVERNFLDLLALPSSG